MPTISELDALPAGSRLGEFEIQKVLGVGGFGIVYLAFDHALQRDVAIKEYMPAALAGRGPGSEVVLRASSHADTFALGLRSFINEARLLARFDHPSLVKVYRFWEEHGTAYMVMPYYRGQTLQQVRRGMSAPPDEAWLRRLITPLLGALECLHREQVFHRDIAPDNILLLDDESGPAQGRPVLLDLGAARKVIGDHTQVLTAIVKPSFAPIEQYAETAQIRQGPWTDLYALAAVLHFCVTGRPPSPATARAVHDELPSLTQMRAGLASGFDCHYSESFARAVDHALAVRPQDRPESISAWRVELAGIASSPGDAGGPNDDVWSPQTVLVKVPDRDAPAAHQRIEAQAYMTTIPAAGKLHAPPAWTQSTLAKDPTQASPESPRNELVPPTMPVPAPASLSLQAAPARADQRMWIKGGLVVLLITALVAVWWLQRVSKKVSAPAVEPVVSTSRLKEPARPGAAGAPGKASSVKTSSKDKEKVLAKGEQDEPDKSRRQRARQEAVDTVAKDEADRLGGESSDALNPRKACAGKSFILLAICMKRHCSRSEYSAHPECERMRQQEAAQRPNY